LLKYSAFKSLKVCLLNEKGELKDSTQRSEHKIYTKWKVGDQHHLNALKLFFSVSTPDIFSIFARSHQTISDPSTHNLAVTNYSHKKFFLIFLFPRLRSINKKQFIQFLKSMLSIIKKHHFV
jgi:hypothetical protein